MKLHHRAIRDVTCHTGSDLPPDTSEHTTP